MSVTGSVSRLIPAAKSGDEQAVAELWNRYYPRLTKMVRRRLRQAPLSSLDEDDVASTTFESFFRRAEDGQFDALRHRGELWLVLMRIAERKLVNEIRKMQTLKRGGGRVQGEDPAEWPDDSFMSLEDCIGQDLEPEYLVILQESYCRLLRKMPDDLQHIVRMRLEGWTHREIAARVRRSVVTVERRLRLVRDKWCEELK